jgi:hypothetical protein
MERYFRRFLRLKNIILFAIISWRDFRNRTFRGRIFRGKRVRGETFHGGAFRAGNSCLGAVLLIINCQAVRITGDKDVIILFYPFKHCFDENIQSQFLQD